MSYNIALMNTSKYPVYKNDIKFKKFNEIDSKNALYIDCSENDLNQDIDSINYRINECIRENYDLLDLSNMTSNCIDQLIDHPQYKLIQKNLKHLFITNSQIYQIHSLQHFHNLETIDLNNNFLKLLPLLPNTIQELNIENNQLTQINQLLPNLKRLFCQNNLIQNILLCNSIERLQCQNNPITSIEPFDGQLPNLYYADISNTAIKNIIPMDKLKYLNCSNTAIISLPKLSSLKTLIANNSSLSDISLIDSLESIQIINNHINHLHYSESLKELIFHKSQHILFSNKFKINYLQENRNNIYKVVFHHK